MSRYYFTAHAVGLRCVPVCRCCQQLTRTSSLVHPSLRSSLPDAHAFQDEELESMGLPDSMHAREFKLACPETHQIVRISAHAYRSALGVCPLLEHICNTAAHVIFLGCTDTLACIPWV